MRSLGVERTRLLVISVGAALVALSAWTIWLTRARVTVYETSVSARVEAMSAAHSVDAPVAGRIKAHRLLLGAEVQSGDVLVELDDVVEVLRLAEERARLETIGPELEATRRVVQAQEKVILAERGGLSPTLEQARAREEEGAAALRFAEQQLVRATRMATDGLISTAELERARADVERARAAHLALAKELGRQTSSLTVRETETRTRIEELRRQVTALEGRRSTLETTVRILEHEIERRRIRAPVGGRVADVSRIAVGAQVKEGDKLASIVPNGELRVVAEFPPAAAGRLKPMQAVRVRLDGFPWTQYGMLSGSVRDVASESRDGKIRAELTVERSPRIPLDHGLPGVAEVAVEQVSPATLILRAVGAP